MDAVALFEVDESRRVPEPPKLSADARRTQRQLEVLAAGYHPLAKTKLHSEAAPFADRSAPGRRCGNCRFREVLGYRHNSFPKCMFPGDLGADDFEALGPPRVTHGVASDVRAWWPACADHTYGDGLSVDAARCVQAVA